MNIQKLCSLIDENKNELFNLLSSLIKINSENFGSRGNEKNMAEYVHKLCLELGMESSVYSPLDIPNFTECEDYMDGRNLEERYCVSAKVKGTDDVNELMKYVTEKFSAEVRVMINTQLRRCCFL